MVRRSCCFLLFLPAGCKDGDMTVKELLFGERGVWVRKGEKRPQ